MSGKGPGRYVGSREGKQPWSAGLPSSPPTQPPVSAASCPKLCLARPLTPGARADAPSSEDALPPAFRPSWWLAGQAAVAWVFLELDFPQ